jgi:hypothetical protein
MPDNGPSHYFHAEAHSLSGKLELPFKTDIKKQAFVKLQGQLADLSDEEKAQRNYFSQHAKPFRLEGILSYASAHTQVLGHESKKRPGAAVTLATSVVEDLNILNVVTADRVVAQVSTTHLPGVYSPRVTFLGTHFENLRIARHKTEPFLNLSLASEPLDGKTLWLDKGTSIMTSFESQYERLKLWLDGLGGGDPSSSSSLTNKYYGGAPKFDQLRQEAAAAREADLKTGNGESNGITCSLVDNDERKEGSAKAARAIQIPPPAKACGHVIHVPNFGNIFLAELTVKHNSFELIMIRTEMGCLADGSLKMGVCNVNGKGSGGGGGGTKVAAGG